MNKTTSTTLARSEAAIAATELLHAAYHEAGHKIVYECFGGAGYAVVWRNPSEASDERAWRGYFRPSMSPECPNGVGRLVSGMKRRRFPKNWKACVGLAGLVAEQILQGETDPDLVAQNIFEIVHYDDGASASDLESMGFLDPNDFRLPGLPVKQVVRYLLAEWVLVEQEAKSLMANVLEDFATEQVNDYVGTCKAAKFFA